ncbi:ABC-type lipoprotein export system ATPase subunit/cell division protein FtsB [Rhizobium leguminosarum]|uniref:ABC-type lipoprotein export system ATPase subunit/cell division protein FtsB n=1 Tax=Rhizobium leguminosarum TaxID=384 RepID=A0AAE2MLV8_RHILE|nr:MULTISPECIES: ABC transporter [Rhizobium]MBB4291500.1 ABC-type lipoprotein export system ATPase subunit/cell division protein FtsB [Rhizobium leguminosarum]MBB4296197.1 ABC-type lipoprotein export system ATPase subunit/cell division protein FtsB [Rhizobium leguminosarum]MBB4308544.1 ABC-type lipoprotein export system ATPase subunit/cell division protein FtsB [Rhizobium leguminosarum]MBB4416379.1 ABC-type lipoprotein export system ATPase subunit/cell division protein FtsB [Rhizobium leguminos
MVAYAKGSEWRQWDLHVHSPYSFHWAGQKIEQGNEDVVIDRMVDAMNKATPSVYGLMDYWTFDGWLALKRRQGKAEATALEKVVFPGIELRLVAPFDGRLNAHVIFSDKIQDQLLADFKSRLKLALGNQPLSDSALRDYARSADADKLKLHGRSPDQVKNDDAYALLVGCEIAEITAESYRDAIAAVPEGLALGFMPFDTYDGLSKVHWDKHYAYALGLFKTSPIFEVRDPDTAAAFSGVRTPKNDKWFEQFQASLGRVPRLSVSGSDAHKFVGTLGDNNDRGYGDFPSNRITWIKADPTWKGLLQAVKEPALRSFIGEVPPKVRTIRENSTYYMSRVSVTADNEKYSGTWLDGTDLELNADLVAIIGNKGSGKSALADVISAVGDSQQHHHFSFLKPRRFKGSSGEPAKGFSGELNWLSGKPLKRNLNDIADPSAVEMVRYIPQGRFEALCNAHVEGRSDEFERELRAVIFSHVPNEVRLDASDFDRLIERQEAPSRAKLNELRRTLATLNEEIVDIEEQMLPAVRTGLQNLLDLKRQERQAHIATKPLEIAAPTGGLSPVQQAATAHIAGIVEELSQMDEKLASAIKVREQEARRRQAIANLQSRVEILKSQYADFLSTTAVDWGDAHLKAQDVVKLTVDDERLIAEIKKSTALEAATTSQSVVDEAPRPALLAEKARLTETLNAPQQQYQAYLGQLTAWQTTLGTIEGSAASPESEKGLEARLARLDTLPDQLDAKREKRRELAKSLHGVLDEQRASRAALFEPIQNLVEGNRLIGAEYKLEFQARLTGALSDFSEKIFSVVKQQSGVLRGQAESNAALKAILDKTEFSNADQTVHFVEEALAMIKSVPGDGDISAILRKDQTTRTLYDYMFGLSYLEPTYTLLFQDTPIEQLSPGQRGALLLIFYLLVDTKRNPIVLDQPEENLDNETIVSLLVPVVIEAKKHRQIIMVTHNPNLAVVCDAEQIIHATFSRADGQRIEYRSGSIENEETNLRVVDVLEGTMRAFNNRGGKYHGQ